MLLKTSLDKSKITAAIREEEETIILIWDAETLKKEKEIHFESQNENGDELLHVDLQVFDGSKHALLIVETHTSKVYELYDLQTEKLVRAFKNEDQEYQLMGILPHECSHEKEHENFEAELMQSQTIVIKKNDFGRQGTRPQNVA